MENEGVFIVNRKLFRPSLTEVKDQYPARGGHDGSVSGQRKKPAPPEQTHAESFYFVKQMQSHTPVTVALTDGEQLHGVVEWYDRDCIKLTRFGSPNLLVYKHSIKYIFKEGEEAAQGGNGNGNGHDGN
jgi:host factor-I protein